MTDLRTALNALAERGTAVGSQRLRQRVAFELAGGNLKHDHGTRRSRTGWILAAACVIVALAVGLPLLVRSNGTAPTLTTGPAVTVPTTPPTTTPPPTSTTTTTSTTVPEPSPMSWSRVDDPALVSAGGLMGLISTDRGFYAVGGKSVWRSTDGTKWDRVDIYEPGTPAGVVDVASGPDDVLIAVGFVDGYPAVWISEDGTSWDLEDRDPNVFPTHGMLAEVVAADVGWIAVGQAETGDDGWAGPAGTFAGVWSSADGVTWEFVVDPIETPTSEWGTAHVTELLTWNGTIFAVGYSQNLNTYHATPAAWASEDGRVWHRIAEANGYGGVERPAGQPDRGAWIEGATATDTALYAVGLEMNWMEPPSAWSLAVWRSEDGSTWSLLPTEFEAPGRSTHGLDLKPIAGDDHLLVTIEMCKYVWASTDRGNTWTQVAELELGTDCGGGTAWALTYDGSSFVASGWDEEDPAVWIGSWIGE